MGGGVSQPRGKSEINRTARRPKRNGIGASAMQKEGRGNRPLKKKRRLQESHLGGCLNEGREKKGEREAHRSKVSGGGGALRGTKNPERNELQKKSTTNTGNEPKKQIKKENTERDGAERANHRLGGAGGGGNRGGGESGGSRGPLTTTRCHSPWGSQRTGKKVST